MRAFFVTNYVIIIEVYLKWHCFHMWVLYFAIESSTILILNNNCLNMQYLHVNHKSWLNVQYHLLTSRDQIWLKSIMVGEGLVGRAKM
jgi:hypothetical protein